MLLSRSLPNVILSHHLSPSSAFLNSSTNVKILCVDLRGDVTKGHRTDEGDGGNRGEECRVGQEMPERIFRAAHGEMYSRAHTVSLSSSRLRPFTHRIRRPGLRARRPTRGEQTQRGRRKKSGTRGSGRLVLRLV